MSVLPPDPVPVLRDLQDMSDYETAFRLQMQEVLVGSAVDGSVGQGHRVVSYHGEDDLVAALRLQSTEYHSKHDHEFSQALAQVAKSKAEILAIDQQFARQLQDEERRFQDDDDEDAMYDELDRFDAADYGLKEAALLKKNLVIRERTLEVLRQRADADGPSALAPAPQRTPSERPTGKRPAVDDPPSPQRHRV
ncbi:hypothetical protein HKX48_009325 [Thoreauomyces humboldtii]|nr:hypothetical protein HKX48_009325 [Thoreauomyces humboldtii]